jgi:aminoglycoside phosphotransferase (APT) family kinase protein
VVPSPTDAGDAPTSPGLVGRLVAEQFPSWRDLPIEPVESAGTDHDIYRLGPDLVVRLPRRAWSSRQGTVEAQWLSRLGPHLPLAIPTPLALGEPAQGYPFRWSVHAWLPGRSADSAPLDLDQAATDLAGFAMALRGVPTDDAPPRLPGRRGCPLAEADETVRKAVRRLHERVDADAAIRSWAASLEASAWHRTDVWVHGDLVAGNMLTVDRRLTAVIDFGGLGVGDPSCDLQAAWSMFRDESRSTFRTAMAADDDMWLRGRGWALCQAVTALAGDWPNPSVAERAHHTLLSVLNDDWGR